MMSTWACKQEWWVEGHIIRFAFGGTHPESGLALKAGDVCRGHAFKDGVIIALIRHHCHGLYICFDYVLNDSRERKREKGVLSPKSVAFSLDFLWEVGIGDGINSV